MLFGGVQLLTLGIIGEFLGKVLQEVKGRPSYIIREASETRARSVVGDMQERLTDSRSLP